MRILHVTAPADVGGLESVVHGLAIGQRTTGHEVHVAACLHSSRRPTDFLHPLEEAGVALHCIRVGARSYLQERRRLVELCETLRPDVVHSHGLRPDAVTAASAARHGRPIVATVHGYLHPRRCQNLGEWVQQRALRRFDAVVVVSRPLRDRLRRAGVADERVHTVRNGWIPTGPPPHPRAEARGTLGIPRDAFHLGWVGRITEEKGPDVFLEALGLLPEIPFVASMIGEGAMTSALRVRARKLGLDRKIRWHGQVPAASRLFRGFDALVLSSRTEGTPIVLFEAMAVDVPIIASTVGGVPDVVGPQEALLVPPEDPRALAHAIRRMVQEEPADRTRRTEAAGRHLERSFGAAQWLARYDRIYSALARQDPGVGLTPGSRTGSGGEP